MELETEGTPVNVALLDQIGLAITQNTIPQLTREKANEIFIKFAERSDAFLYVGQIMAQSNLLFIKFNAMQILCTAIKTRWLSIPPDEKQNIVGFLVSFVKTPNIPPQLLIKCNQALIEVAKYDYPNNWPDLFDIFIQNLYISRDFCLNFIKFLSAFAVDLTECAVDSVTSLRAVEMKNGFTEQFPAIFEILKNMIGEDIEMSRLAILALKKIICIENVDVIIFQSPWLNDLIQIHLPRPELAVAVIGLLTKLITRPNIPLNESHDTYNTMLGLFNTAVITLHKAVGDQFDETSELSGDDNFAESFVSAVSSLINNFPIILKEESFLPQIHQILRWIKYITIVSDNDRFETCIEFWLSILRRLSTETHNCSTPCPQPYAEFLHPMRVILIERMPSPIIIVPYVEVDGSHQKRVSNNTNFGSFYSTARQCMIFLTNFDPEDMTNVILERLNELITTAMNLDAVKSLCWAIGSISNASPAHEPIFIPKMLQYLFQICDAFQTPIERANVAEGIVFVCSQYSKFLSKFYPLLKSIIFKMLSFLNQKVAELQEYTLESLKSIALYCQQILIRQQPNEDYSILEYLFENTNNIISNLSPENIPTFYEILSALVSGIQNEDTKTSISSNLITDLIQRVGSIMNSFDPSNHDCVRTLSVVLRCHSVLPNYLGRLYLLQIQTFIPEIVNFYLALSQIIANSMEGCLLFRQLRSDILNILQRSINYITYNEQNKSFIPILMETKTKLIEDYAANPRSRVPEVLLFISVLLLKLNEQMISCFPEIFTNLFSTTYEMIVDQINFGDFTYPFYRFVQSFCYVYLTTITEIDPQMTDFIMQTLVFGTECLNSDVRELCVSIISDLFGKLNGNPQNNTYSQFLRKYSIPILLTTLQRLFDLSYKQSFQTNINMIRYFLLLPHVMEQAGVVAGKLCELLPNKPQNEVFQITEEIFNAAKDFHKFRNLMRDFLVSARQISITDPDLNTVEREEMIKELNEKFHSIPGYSDENSEDNDSALSQLPNTLNSLSIS